MVEATDAIDKSISPEKGRQLQNLVSALGNAALEEFNLPANANWSKIKYTVRSGPDGTKQNRSADLVVDQSTATLKVHYLNIQPPGDPVAFQAWTEIEVDGSGAAQLLDYPESYIYGDKALEPIIECLGRCVSEQFELTFSSTES